MKIIIVPSSQTCTKARETAHRSHFDSNGTPLQYSCLENPMDGGAWWAAVHGVMKSRRRLSDFTFTFYFHALEKAMAPTPVLLPGKSHGQRSLVGCSPQGVEHNWATSLSCIGEGNGSPLQCPCLENPRDGGAWWAAVCGVTESDTTEAT